MTADWDAEWDFVSIGSGIAGLAGAIAAADRGLRVAVLEKSPLLGGVTALSFGELWMAGTHLQQASRIEDSEEDGFRYLERVGMGFNTSAMTRRLCESGPDVLRFFETAGVGWRLIPDFPDYYWPEVDGSRQSGRYIEADPFAGRDLGEWRERVRVTPHPNFRLTHGEMVEQGGLSMSRAWDSALIRSRQESDVRCLGPGLVGHFVRIALDHGVALMTSTAAVELVRNDFGVVGLRARSGSATFSVGARNGVLIAAGGYDWDVDMKREYDTALDFVSAVPASVEGDSIRLAGRIGARFARVPVSHRLGYGLPGEDDNGGQRWRLAGIELGLPHSIVVDGTGRRFADESFYPGLGYAVQVLDGARLERPHYPCWAILDSQQREKYGFGAITGSAAVPPGFAHCADTIPELARAAGIDPEGLVGEVERFNGFVQSGVDFDYHRGERAWSNHMNGDRMNHPNPNLGTVRHPPFFAVPLRLIGTGLGSLGLAADPDGRVLDHDGRAIDRLYVAGSAMAMTDCGAGYQSGVANTRGMVFGYLAALDASAGKPRPKKRGSAISLSSRAASRGHQPC